MFHLHVRYRSRDGGTSCESARQYIAREGRFAKRPDKVRFVASLNMPVWAGSGSAQTYWQAAEGRHSRANARSAILFEFALPKELAEKEQNVLAMSMAEMLSSMGSEEVGFDCHLPVTLAIHEGYGRNPHVHLLLSTSINDRIVRNEKTWFRRHSSKSPESGGARRSEYVTKRRWLYRVREIWATLANTALARVGKPPSLDHRSHVDRGLTINPDMHLGPRISHMSGQGIATARGRRQAELASDNQGRLALELSILSRRRNLEQIELDAELQSHAWRVLASIRDDGWRAVLGQHPLGGDAADLRSASMVMVLDAESINAPRLHAAYSAPGTVERFAKSVGTSWEVFQTGHGIWAIKPGQDSVVMLGPGYAATDAEDDESIAALIAGARILPFAKPVLLVRDWIKGVASELAQRAGLDWQVRARKAPRLHLAVSR